MVSGRLPPGKFGETFQISRFKEHYNAGFIKWRYSETEKTCPPFIAIRVIDYRPLSYYTYARSHDKVDMSGAAWALALKIRLGFSVTRFVFAGRAGAASVDAKIKYCLAFLGGLLIATANIDG